MSTAEEFHEGPWGSNAVEKDPWGHEHGEGDRGESVVPYQMLRPDAGAHLIGEPVKIEPHERGPLVAILVTATLAAAAIAAVVMMDLI